MTPNDISTFERQIGKDIPLQLTTLLRDEHLRAGQPVEFRSSQPPFVLGIQYLLSLGDPKHYDTERKRVAFAVSTDGFQLIADLTDDAVPILQNEFGNIDYLDITIKEVLAAEKTVIT